MLAAGGTAAASTGRALTATGKTAAKVAAGAGKFTTQAVLSTAAEVAVPGASLALHTARAGAGVASRAAARAGHTKTAKVSKFVRDSLNNATINRTSVPFPKRVGIPWTKYTVRNRARAPIKTGLGVAGAAYSGLLWEPEIAKKYYTPDSKGRWRGATVVRGQDIVGKNSEFKDYPDNPNFPKGMEGISDYPKYLKDRLTKATVWGDTGSLGTQGRAFHADPARDTLTATQRWGGRAARGSKKLALFGIAPLMAFTWGLQAKDKYFPADSTTNPASNTNTNNTGKDTVAKTNTESFFERARNAVLGDENAFGGTRDSNTPQANRNPTISPRHRKPAQEPMQKRPGCPTSLDPRRLAEVGTNVKRGLSFDIDDHQRETRTDHIMKILGESIAERENAANHSRRSSKSKTNPKPPHQKSPTPPKEKRRVEGPQARDKGVLAPPVDPSKPQEPPAKITQYTPATEKGQTETPQQQTILRKSCTNKQRKPSRL